MYVTDGVDKVGRSIIHNKKSPSENVVWTEALHHLELQLLVYTIERAIRQGEIRQMTHQVPLPVQAEFDNKEIWLIDMYHYNSGSATPWHVTQSLIEILRYHYPERLHKAIILDAPWMLRQLCNLIRPFIDKVTAEKVQFINTQRHSQKQQKTQQQNAEASGGDSTPSTPETYIAASDPCRPSFLQIVPSTAQLPVEYGGGKSFQNEEYLQHDPMKLTHQQTLKLFLKDQQSAKNQPDHDHQTSDKDVPWWKSILPEKKN